MPGPEASPHPQNWRQKGGTRRCFSLASSQRLHDFAFLAKSQCLPKFINNIPLSNATLESVWYTYCHQDKRMCSTAALGNRVPLGLTGWGRGVASGLGLRLGIAGLYVQESGWGSRFRPRMLRVVWNGAS